MNQTISCKALARITTPQTLKIEGHIKKKKVQEVKDHIEKEEMNPTISCNPLVEITTPQTIKIEGHIEKENVQEVKDRASRNESGHILSSIGRNYHSSNSRDRRAYQEEKGSSSERSHRASTTSSPTFKG